ncbi:ribosome-associated translation inhibitor RaiA [candidate division KSB1 bacterium]|nr:ribosome-associated translation inhibitor RaiA [candidate division KSB1 bacterium]
MRITVTARHFKLPEELKVYATDVAKGLKKYYDGIIDCDVVLDWQRENKICEMRLGVLGRSLAARENSDNIYKSIDRAGSKLERQLRKFKTKLKNRNKIAKQGITYGLDR